MRTKTTNLIIKADTSSERLATLQPGQLSFQYDGYSALKIIAKDWNGQTFGGQINLEEIVLDYDMSSESSESSASSASSGSSQSSSSSGA